MVYAIAGGRVFRSADAGATWSAVTPAGTQVSTLAIDPARSATIYVGASAGPAVLRSLTTLATLREFDTGLPAGVTRALAIDRTTGTVYLGAESAGLFRLP